MAVHRITSSINHIEDRVFDFFEDITDPSRYNNQEPSLEANGSKPPSQATIYYSNQGVVNSANSNQVQSNFPAQLGYQNILLNNPHSSPHQGVQFRPIVYHFGHNQPFSNNNGLQQQYSGQPSPNLIFGNQDTMSYLNPNTLKTVYSVIPNKNQQTLSVPPAINYNFAANKQAEPTFATLHHSSAAVAPQTTQTKRKDNVAWAQPQNRPFQKVAHESKTKSPNKALFHPSKSVSTVPISSPFNARRSELDVPSKIEPRNQIFTKRSKVIKLSLRLPSKQKEITKLKFRFY